MHKMYIYTKYIYSKCSKIAEMAFYHWAILWFNKHMTR